MSTRGLVVLLDIRFLPSIENPMRAVKNKYILSQKLVILRVLKVTTLLVVSRDLTNGSERRNEAARARDFDNL